MSAIKPIVALTIAGSDSSAGAGLQADLRVFNHLGLYGKCSVTALTAQNTTGVEAVVPAAADIVVSQLEALLADGVPGVTKTGMLATLANLEAVVDYAVGGRLGLLVVDPVLAATAGKQLSEAALAAGIASRLVPVCDLITPNHEEARLLTGIEIENEAQAAQAAAALVQMGAGAACVTGGHFSGVAIDVLHDGSSLHVFKGERLGRGDEFHGTGCQFSAAVAGYLALGHSMPDAVAAAKKLISQFIGAAVAAGPGMMIPWPPA